MKKDFNWYFSCGQVLFILCPCVIISWPQYSNGHKINFFYPLSLEGHRTELTATHHICSPLSFCIFFLPYCQSFQRLPNGPSAGLEDGELERQREGEIERQRVELSQLRERLALMCRQVSVSLLWWTHMNSIMKIVYIEQKELHCYRVRVCLQD